MSTATGAIMIGKWEIGEFSVCIMHGIVPSQEHANNAKKAKETALIRGPFAIHFRTDEFVLGCLSHRATGVRITSIPIKDMTKLVEAVSVLDGLATELLPFGWTDPFAFTPEQKKAISRIIGKAVKR